MAITPEERKAQEERQHDADSAFCSTCRAPAEAAFAKRGELMSASKAAWDSGDKAKAKELSDAAKAEGARAEALSVDACQKIFAFKNAAGRVHPLEIDLHGLQVVEALGFTKSRLERDARAGPATAPMLVVIYGAGHHSVGNKQKIKPAILDLIASFPTPHTTREDWNGITNSANPGCCTVQYGAAAAGGAAVAVPTTAGLPPTPAAEERQPGCRCSIM